MIKRVQIRNRRWAAAQAFSEASAQSPAENEDPNQQPHASKFTRYNGRYL